MCGVAFISGCSSVQFGVLFVGNGLTPFVAAIFAGNFHSNVAEPAVGLGTVPVLDVGRDGDHGAGGQADGRFAAVQTSSWPPPLAAWWICQLLLHKTGLPLRNPL